MQPTPRIFITGFGLATPLGHNAWETFAALLAGRTIADRCAELPGDIGPVDLVRAIGSVSFAQHSSCDPAVELAERAGREALMMAGVSDDEVPAIPCIVATSKGAVHALTAAANQYQPVGASHARPLAPTPAGIPPLRLRDAHLVVILGPHGYLTHHLRQRLNLGDTTHLVAACASSLMALHRARLRLLHQAPPRQAPRRILILTADAALLPSFIHAYQRLGVLAPLTREGYRGRPLDRAAAGFMIAQAGAAIVLERIDDPDFVPPRHAVEVIDSAEACEAHDLIRTDPAMPALRRVARQLLTGRAIDLVHPHATGTAGQTPHDDCELKAIAGADFTSGGGDSGSGTSERGLTQPTVNEASSLGQPNSGRRGAVESPSPIPRHCEASGYGSVELPRNTPPLHGLSTGLGEGFKRAEQIPSAIVHPNSTTDLYAHKGALGHTLGASGLISTILACLCARTGRRPPMPWLANPIAAGLAPAVPQRPIRLQAIFASGFGGHTAGVVLRSRGE